MRLAGLRWGGLGDGSGSPRVGVGYLCGGFLQEEGREAQIAKAEWWSSQGASPDHLAGDPDTETGPFQSDGGVGRGLGWRPCPLCACPCLPWCAQAFQVSCVLTCPCSLCWPPTRRPAHLLLIILFFLGSSSLHPWAGERHWWGRGGWNLEGGPEPWAPEGNGGLEGVGVSWGLDAWVLSRKLGSWSAPPISVNFLHSPFPPKQLV